MLNTQASLALPTYEVYALKYATRSARRPANFVGGDLHDAPMPLDYYVWVIRNQDRVILVDTGFCQDMADKRGRQLLRTPTDALALLGIQNTDVQDIIITHMHNDHVGTFDAWPHARFHLQDAEMAYATGRHMSCDMHNKAYEPDHVAGLIRMAYANRITFHDGEGDIAPGISVHRVGGHTAGMQIVRVNTTRGWLVLASDASHFYEHFQQRRSFTLVFNIGELFQGYARMEALAQSPEHIIPGHDPLVMEKYPPVNSALAGVIARLDMPPTA